MCYHVANVFSFFYFHSFRVIFLCFVPVIVVVAAAVAAAATAAALLLFVLQRTSNKLI